MPVRGNPRVQAPKMGENTPQQMSDRQQFSAKTSIRGNLGKDRTFHNITQSISTRDTAPHYQSSRNTNQHNEKPQAPTGTRWVGRAGPTPAAGGSLSYSSSHGGTRHPPPRARCTPLSHTASQAQVSFQQLQQQSENGTGGSVSEQAVLAAAMTCCPHPSQTCPAELRCEQCGYLSCLRA